MPQNRLEKTASRNGTTAETASARRAKVLVHGVPAGILEEHTDGFWLFRYFPDYTGPSVSLTIPADKSVHRFDRFPPFFEGLLPEGEMLEGLLRQHKIDRNDLFSQLMAVGQEMVGAVTVEEAN